MADCARCSLVSMFYPWIRGVRCDLAWHDAWVLALPSTLTDQRVAEILSLQELLAGRCLSEAAHDAWVWSGPCFSTWAADRLLRDQEDSEDLLFLQWWQLVWKCRLPSKIKVFAWPFFTTAPYDEVLAVAHGPVLPVECPMYAWAMEDCSLLFFACLLA